MKLILFMVVGCVSLSAGVFAGNDDFLIKVIQEDGSVEVLDLRGTSSSAPAVEAPVKEEPEPVKEIVKEKVVKPVQPEPESAPAFVTEDIDEVAAEVEAVDVPVPAKKPAVKAVSKKKAAKKKAPVKKKVVKAAPAPEAAELAAPVGGEISRGRAVSIALDYAPPSSDMEVFRTEFEGAKVFTVVFKTEDGFYEVMIDPASGDVVKKGESVRFNTQAAPGHLPSGLR